MWRTALLLSPVIANPQWEPTYRVRRFVHHLLPGNSVGWSRRVTEGHQTVEDCRLLYRLTARLYVTYTYMYYAHCRRLSILELETAWLDVTFETQTQIHTTSGPVILVADSPRDEPDEYERGSSRTDETRSQYMHVVMYSKRNCFPHCLDSAIEREDFCVANRLSPQDARALRVICTSFPDDTGGDVAVHIDSRGAVYNREVLIDRYPACFW